MLCRSGGRYKSHPGEGKGTGKTCLLEVRNFDEGFRRELIPRFLSTLLQIQRGCCRYTRLILEPVTVVHRWMCLRTCRHGGTFSSTLCGRTFCGSIKCLRTGKGDRRYRQSVRVVRYRSLTVRSLLLSVLSPTLGTPTPPQLRVTRFYT